MNKIRYLSIYLPQEVTSLLFEFLDAREEEQHILTNKKTKTDTVYMQNCSKDTGHKY